MDGFIRRSLPAHRSTAAAVHVPLSEIEPPYRTPSTLRDWRGFDHDRLVRILNWIVTGAEIEHWSCCRVATTRGHRTDTGYVTDIIGFMRRLQRASNSCLLSSWVVRHEEEPGPRHEPAVSSGAGSIA
jgi:hypothetical protein